MKPKDLLESLEKTDRTMEHLEEKETNVVFDYGAPIMHRMPTPVYYGGSMTGLGNQLGGYVEYNPGLQQMQPAIQSPFLQAQSERFR